MKSNLRKETVLQIFGLALLLLYSQFSMGQVKHPTNKQEIIGVCAKFMESFKNEKFEAAFDLLKPYSVIENYQLDTIANTAKKQIKGLSNSYGKIISYEALPEKNIKNSLVQLNYLLKFERDFLRLSFVLYYNGSSWTITNFKYNSEIDDLFSVSAKQP
jgi:hypothetical protein